MSQLDAVLKRIDADLDASLGRLFALLRIQSVSTDPAYKDSCRAAAEFVAADLNSIGFAAEVRATEGHPIVVGKSGNGKANGKPRDVFAYVIHEGKLRAPAGAMALIERLRN